MYRLPQHLAARSRRACPERSRGNPDDAYLPMLFGAFQPQQREQQDLPCTRLIEPGMDRGNEAELPFGRWPLQRRASTVEKL